MPTIHQPPSSFAQTANPYVKLSYHQILVPPQFTNSINSISSSIFIQWIPGSSSIPGNELANKEAKEATYIDTNTILHVSFPISMEVVNESIRDDLSIYEHVAQVYQHQKAFQVSKQIKNRKDDLLFTLVIEWKGRTE